ncbi:MAG: DEAD/DEAH box helicase [Mesotoga sp.]|uniref:DEAD/DEAH box helicase n=1 Tax=Mesotoga sp. TaxID=2053577 RepID=UPI0035667425
MKNFVTTTEIMPHQASAVDKVLPSRVGALFMEMGTGKSRTMIEMVRRRRFKIDHVVWFCPVALKETCRQELLKHTDSRDIYVFDDKTTEEFVPDASWYVIGIESMSSSNRVVLAAKKVITEKSMVVLDESSYIKGHHSMRTERITYLSRDCKYRLIMTGTPLSQGVVDLYAQMRFLSPKILGYSSFYSFAANHLEYSDKFPGMIMRSHNTSYLAAKIQPYTYQVTKKECLSLPDKTYEGRYFYMTEEQRHYYEMAKEEILNEFVEDWDSIAIFRLFTALQEIVCGFWNHKSETIEINSRRVQTLMAAIQEIPPENKIIIFTKFQHDVDVISQEIVQEYGEGSIATFSGQVPEKKRLAEVENFRNGARFFIATQSCGGHGLTLNEAHYVIFFNNAFKYSERMQAEDRCHRIGQEHKVTYIDIHCGGSIDDRIEIALQTKGNAVRSFKAEVDKVKGKKAKIKELLRNL